MRKSQSLSLRIGSEIEVSSEEDGFEGAWFKAFLKDKPGKSARKKLRVVYKELEGDDAKLLTETVYRRVIRPKPPENLFSTTGEFEEGTVVEAAQRGGWWTNVFVKKLDQDKYLVYCESPPDLIQYKRKQLRLHFDWIKEKWVRPQIKELGHSCGTMVEVKEKRNDVVWWVPSVIVKEKKGGKSFIVKACKYLSWNDEDEVKPPKTVSSRSVRHVPPPLSVENYELSEHVEVFSDPGWRQGVVKGILCDKKYAVCLEATNELLEFKHSDLRPSKESVSKRFMRTSTRTNATITPQRSLSPVGNGEAAIDEDETVDRGEPSLAQGSGNEMADDVRDESGTTDITATPRKQIEDKTQEKASHEKTLEPTRNQNGMGNESTWEKMPEEHNYEDGNRKRRRVEVEHNSDLNETANESVSPVIPSPVITATPLKQRETGTQEKTFLTKTIQPLRNQNSLTREKPKESPLTQVSGNKIGGFVVNAKESDPPVTPSPSITATPLKQAEAETQGKTPKRTLLPMRNQNSVGNDATRENEETNEDNNRKRKREQILGSSANVGETRANDSTMVLPFEKKLRTWKTFESMEVFKTVPQSPHFSPLMETRESSRETSALGLMCSYSELVEEVKGPFISLISRLEFLNDSFAELEKHGFDVKEPYSRVQKLLSLKARQANKMEQLKSVEKEIAVEESKKVEIELKILELQRKKEVADKELEDMELQMENLD
ncbi:hypothetical protein AALP_AA4G264000 [Arabis alpina]|uniref:Agenet domain-containing protein n=1 Tax=Arabis alpina TaxID=50452 RepID=A0A087H5T7_ARAAL|nr:hypothetical protein AALP_AA4G264000 [Arabis alpina]